MSKKGNDNGVVEKEAVKEEGPTPEEAYAEKRRIQLEQFYQGQTELTNGTKYYLKAFAYIEQETGATRALIKVMDLITKDIVGDLVIERR